MVCTHRSGLRRRCGRVHDPHRDGDRLPARPPRRPRRSDRGAAGGMTGGKGEEETREGYRPPPRASINRSDSRLTKILAWLCSPQPSGVTSRYSRSGPPPCPSPRRARKDARMLGSVPRSKRRRVKSAWSSSGPLPPWRLLPPPPAVPFRSSPRSCAGRQPSSRGRCSRRTRRRRSPPVRFGSMPRSSNHSAIFSSSKYAAIWRSVVPCTGIP